MLSESSRKIIEETLPDVQERIRRITPAFYDEMLTERSDLLDGLFSRVDQVVGTQPLALAGSITFFASYILNHPTSSPDEILIRVAHKHASLGVPASEYETVYKYLFKAIEKEFGAEYTPEFEKAWTEVYWMMADSLIRIEQGLYESQANEKVNAPFTLVEKKQTTSKTVDLTFKTADDTQLSPVAAGQYLSVIVKTRDGLRQPRQFIALPCGLNQRRIAVQLDRSGEISPLLHALEVGDTVEISNPYGNITLDTITSNIYFPLYIFTQGIGIASALAFAHELAAGHSTRDIIFIHADDSLSTWALHDEFVEAVSKLPNGKIVSFLQESGEGDFTGDIKMRKLEIVPKSFAYVCGPVDFKQTVRSGLIAANVPGRNIQFETFGSDQFMHTATRRTMHRRY